MLNSHTNSLIQSKKNSVFSLKPAKPAFQPSNNTFQQNAVSIMFGQDFKMMRHAETEKQVFSPYKRERQEPRKSKLLKKYEASLEQSD